MDANEYLRRNGYEAAKKSGALAHLQKQYADEIVQPGDPRFEKLYGAKIRANLKKRHELEEKSKELWDDSKKRREFEKGATRKIIR